MSNIQSLPRCPWANNNDALMIAYHDDEWGVPCHDDDALFERLGLEIFQAGLSWRTVLHKRQHFWRAFDGWQPEHVAQRGDADVERLLLDPTIIRNRRKIEAMIVNAQAFGRVQGEHGSFDRYLWAWVDGQTLRDSSGFTAMTLPARTPLSDAITNDLKRRGFQVLGSTVMYAFMQSVGMVDDHLIDCYKFVPRATSSEMV